MRQISCPPAALVVRVHGPGGELFFEPTLGDTVLNAAALTIINITLTTGDTQIPNEYDELIAAVQPLLCGVKISNLRQDSTLQNLNFLGNEASVDPTNLQYLDIAPRLFDQYKLPPQFTYALLRENALLSTDGSSAAGIRVSVSLSTPLQPLLYDIMLLSSDTVNQVIRQAVETDHYVHETVVSSLPSIMKLLSQYTEESNAYMSDERSSALISIAEGFVTSGAAGALPNVLQQDAGGDLPQLLDNIKAALATSSSSTSPDAILTTKDQSRKSAGISLPSDQDAIRHAIKLHSVDQKTFDHWLGWTSTIGKLFWRMQR